MWAEERNGVAGVVAIIPARYGSSRFPGKPLAMVLGVPLIIRVFQQVVTAFPSEQVIVATDDGRIREVCEGAGIRVVMTSAICPTGTDRVWEAASELEAEMIVNVQGDEPLVRTEDILAVVWSKRANPGHVVNAMCTITDRRDIVSPNVPKVVVNERDELVYMSRAPIPYVKAEDVVHVHRRQVCIYGFNRAELRAFAEYGHKSRLEKTEDIEILRFLDLGIPVRMVEVSEASVAVDVPEDVPRVERLLERER
ncbi:MAG: 3-deoxy-manno-octulosonate cytidylyltransferase [Candidatus Methylomirabilales bacterium]